MNRLQKGGENTTRLYIPTTLEEVSTIPGEVLDNLNNNVRRLANLDDAFLNEYYNINGTNKKFTTSTLRKIDVKAVDWKKYEKFVLEDKKIKDFNDPSLIANPSIRSSAIIHFINALFDANANEWWYVTKKPSRAITSNYNGSDISGSGNYLKLYFNQIKKTNPDFDFVIKYTNLSNCIFEGGELKDVKFHGCNITGCIFKNVKISKCKFINCIANDCEFTSTIFTECEIDNTDFQKSVFHESEWRNDNNTTKQIINNTNFNDCNFTGQSFFTELIIKGNTTFVHCLEAAQFYGVNFQKGVSFNRGGRIDEHITRDATLKYCEFNEINFNQINFETSEFKKSKFISCSLNGTNITGSDLTDVTFIDSNLIGVGLQGSELTGANIENIDFNVIVDGDTDLEEIRFNQRTQFHPEIRLTDIMSEDLSERINTEFGHLPPPPPPPPLRREGVAYEVHNKADNIKLEKLEEFLTKYLKPSSVGDPIEKMKNYINTKFAEGEREQYNMKFNAVVLKLPPGDRLVKNIFNYVLQQPDDFIEIYLKSYTQDCYHAYQGSSNTMSCVKGIYERTFLNLGDAAFASCSAGNCKDEYNEIRSILENVTLDINELTQKWSNSYLETPEIQAKFENIGNMSDEDVAILAEEVKQNYITFMEGEYESKGLLDDSIRAKIKGEADKLDYAFKSGAFGGGRRKRRMGVTRQKKRSSNGRKTRKKKRSGNRK